MSEYLERPEATKEIFIEDGFMRTGDLAYYDEAGRVLLVGRNKEIIK